MALHRFLLPVAAAALASACSASPVNEFAAPQQLGAGPQQTAATAPGASGSQRHDAKPADRDRGLQLVALSLASASDPGNKAYKIGPGDVLEVTVFKVPELSKTVQVSEAGTISYPLVGEVRGGGRTAREIEQDLARLLGAKYLQHPQVSVIVKEHNSQRITLEGAVRKPGVYPIAGGMTLLQATATAGGFVETAEETVLLLRRVDGRRYVGKYDVADIRAGRSPDPELEAGDVIIAPTSNLKEGMNTFLKLVPLATIVPLL